MKNGWWSFWLILFIFVFGTLFGIETAKDGMKQQGAIPGEPQKPYYVTRIEDGKMIVAPLHAHENGTIGGIVHKRTASGSSGQTDASHPVLSKKGALSSLGGLLGQKVSEFTRKILESSLSRIFE